MSQPFVNESQNYNQLKPNIKNQFLNNKYTKTYYQIINRAQIRLIPLEYTEKHHIIPKCKSFNGPNTKKT